MKRSTEEIRILVAEGKIRAGMSRSEIRDLLGEPQEQGGVSRKYKYPSILKYGDVEFHWPLTRSASEADQAGLQLVMVDDWQDGADPVVLLSTEHSGG